MADNLSLQEVVAAIMRGDADENLSAIYDAYRERSKIVRQIKTSTLAATIKAGETRVEINGIKPKYLNGVKGLVTAIERGRGNPYATVKFDAPVFNRGRAINSSPGIPLSCLTVLEA